jgi:LEA14-like dessication related protein
MKNQKSIFILSGLIIIGYSLFRYYRKQVDFLKDITYQIVGVGIRNISLSEVTLDISAKIFNASNVEATVKEIYLDVLMNGVKVGNINEIKDILILPSQTSVVSFSFSFNPRLIAGNIINILSLTTMLKNVIFTLQGYVKVQSSFITTTIPFEYENNLKNLIGKK